MVMWFNVKEAREYLLKNGFVYTLRPRKRREGREVLSYGGFGKKGTVWVRFIKEIKFDEELKEYVKESGFENINKWREKAGESKFLYYVKLISKTP